MKLFMLKSGNRFYKRRAQWVTDPQQATVWTSRQGAISAKGHITTPTEGFQIIEFEAELPAEATAEPALV